MTAPPVPAPWADLPFFRDDWPALAARLAAEPGWQPAAIFRALELTPRGAVRAVVLGQDPYHTPGRATGLAFSFPPGERPQDSLKNVPPYNASQVESGDTTWLSDVRDFFTRESSGYRSWSESAAGRGQQGAMAQAGAMTNLYHASKLIGMDIRNQQAEEVGEIHDLVLDADKRAAGL